MNYLHFNHNVYISQRGSSSSQPPMATITSAVSMNMVHTMQIPKMNPYWRLLCNRHVYSHASYKT